MARDRAARTPEAAWYPEIGMGVVALPRPDLARRGHRHPEMRPKPSTQKDKSTALRATHSPTTARKGESREEGRYRGAHEMLK